jgi:hypothetical protein
LAALAALIFWGIVGAVLPVLLATAAALIVCFVRQSAENGKDGMDGRRGGAAGGFFASQSFAMMTESE